MDESAIADAVAKENARLKREGGPAFPFAYGATNGADGLTKREYMATHLMAGLVANARFGEILSERTAPDLIAEVCADSAVTMADALLAELAK